jgi:hypothetical protein
VKDKEIDLDDELRKAKECSIETDKRFQEVNNSFLNNEHLFLLDCEQINRITRTI